LHAELAARGVRADRRRFEALRQDHMEQLARMQGQLDEILGTLGPARNGPVNWPALTVEEADQQ
jgi:hypothetical protein